MLVWEKDDNIMSGVQESTVDRDTYEQINFLIGNREVGKVFWGSENGYETFFCYTKKDKTL
jgi:hypothetical protein